MNRIIKKTICMALVLLMLFTLCACSSSVTIMEYKGRKLSTNMFSYMLSYQKAYQESYLAYFYYYSNGSYPDSSYYESFWKTETTDEDGNVTTYGDLFFEGVIDSAKYFLLIEYLCDEYKLDITDAETLSTLEEQIQTDVDAAGDKNFLDIILSDYGANLDVHRDYYYTLSKMTVLYEYMYGENGIHKIPDAELREYFDEEYKKYDAVFFPYYEYDDEGEQTGLIEDETITDEVMYEVLDDNYFKMKEILFYFYEYNSSTDKFSTTIMSDEDIKKQKEAAEELIEKIKSGEITFEDALEDHSVKDPLNDNENGGMHKYGKSFEGLDEDTIKEMKAGDIELVLSDVGAHIIYKMETSESDLETELKDGDTVKEELYETLLKEKIAKKADEFIAKVNSGDIDFDSEDIDSGEYQDTTIYTDDDFTDEFLEFIGGVSLNEIKKYEGDDVTDGIVIYRNLATDDDDFTSEYDEIFELLSQEKFYDYLEQSFDQVVVNTTELSNYNFLTAKALAIGTVEDYAGWAE